MGIHCTILGYYWHSEFCSLKKKKLNFEIFFVHITLKLISPVNFCWYGILYHSTNKTTIASYRKTFFPFVVKEWNSQSKTMFYVSQNAGITYWMLVFIKLFRKTNQHKYTLFKYKNSLHSQEMKMGENKNSEKQNKSSTFS